MHQTSSRSWLLRRTANLTLLLSLSSLALVLAIVGVRAGQDQSHHHDESNESSLHDIHKIKHIIIIMQENRSFDTYFGTYPGAAGIPTQDGQFTVCVPDPATNNCVAPFHNRNDMNGGGPHGPQTLWLMSMAARWTALSPRPRRAARAA